MKKIFIVAALLLTTHVANAALVNGPYIGLHAGADNWHFKADGAKEHDTRFAWMMALGARLKSFRAEIEWANVTRAHIDDVKAEQQRYMLQLYYEVPFRSAFRPYLNVGAGAAYTEVKAKNTSLSRSSDETTFAWNGGAGITVNVNRALSFDFGYRYIDSGKPKFFDSSVRMRHHEGYIGTRYTF
ncbi:MAG: porin family protein [Alphaproteobacteria bacterium]|nr:porin family protein [Alphaproteobacteria bacterium]